MFDFWLKIFMGDRGLVQGVGLVHGVNTRTLKCQTISARSADASEALAALLASITKYYSNVTCFFLDCRKDTNSNTIVEVESTIASEDGEKTVKVNVQRQKTEEHLVCLTYPGGQYADHLTLPDGTGLTSAKLTWDLLKRLDMLETLRILLSDGCGVVSFNSLKST